MSDENLMRELAARFYQSGWLRSIEMNQRPNRLGMKVDWTESGREAFMSLRLLFDELGYMDGPRRGGEVHILFEMITDKECPELPQKAYMRPFLQSAVNTRMAESGWITTEEKDKQTIFVDWTEKGLERKRQFQKLLGAMNCSETFNKEFEGIMTFTRACQPSIPSEADLPHNRRF